MDALWEGDLDIGVQEMIEVRSCAHNLILILILIHMFMRLLESLYNPTSLK